VRAWCVVAVIAVASCRSEVEPDLGAPADLSASVDLAADLATASDFSTSPDMAYDFCADVMGALAGATPANCASEFLRDFIRCMSPAGHCYPSTTNGHVVCWDSGVARTSVGGSGRTIVVGTPATQLCRAGGGPDGSFFDQGGMFCLATPTHSCMPDADAGTWYSYNASLSFDDTMFTCPSGEKVAVGALGMACKSALNKLVEPTCDGLGTVMTCPYPL
jgi:hypothetical protein